MSALFQRSDEWLEFRKDKVGASDAPVIMEVSPWKTQYQLWLEKLSIIENAQKSNWAMDRGNNLEAAALQAFCLEKGIEMSPDVMIHRDHKWMMASLDGTNEFGTSAVEIKCPGKEDHAKALAGKIPDKYIPQLQHQLEVLGLDMIYYFSFDGSNGVTIEVNRDDKYIKNLVKKELEFFECLQSFVAPKLVDRDYQSKKDDLWLEASSEWKVISKQLKALETKEKELRDNLIAMSNKQNSIGGGVKLTRSLRKGNVDYSKIPELELIDLDGYRKDPIEVWRISEI